VSELNWDPEPHKRQYYRNAQTGDRAWLVKRDGKDMVRMDRGPVEDIRVFNEREWIEDAPAMADFTDIQIAMVTFEADKALCRQMGDAKKAKREWLNLSDQQRIKWMEDGPQETRRKKLYLAVKKALK
jgi:hypothetical protein